MYRDKAYDLIDVLLCCKKNVSNISKTAVLKTMLRNDLTACVSNL